MNMAAGLQSELKTEGFIHGLDISGYNLLFRDSRNNMGLPARKGSGWFFNATAKSKAGNLHLIFWNANDFYAHRGMKLLQSGSDLDPGIWVSKRDLLGIEYSFSKEVFKGISAGFRAEGWFDLNTGDFSNAGSVYILVNQKYLIKRL